MTVVKVQSLPIITKPGVCVQIPKEVKQISLKDKDEDEVKQFYVFKQGKVSVLFHPESFEVGQKVVSKVSVVSTKNGLFAILKPFNVERNQFKGYRINPFFEEGQEINNLFVKI